MDIAMLFCNLVILNDITHLYYTYSYIVHTILGSYIYVHYWYPDSSNEHEKRKIRLAFFSCQSLLLYRLYSVPNDIIVKPFKDQKGLQSSCKQARYGLSKISLYISYGG